MGMAHADLRKAINDPKKQAKPDPMRIPLMFLMVVLFSCTQADSHKVNATDHQSIVEIKEDLLSLERKWLEAEFVLDTAYVSTLIDSTFIGISANRVSSKKEELKGMYDNISAMRKDSIFLDSLKLEDSIVNVYDNTAVVTFIVHTYKKEKGISTEKRTRFYDVWINRNGIWKAVSSQGTALTQHQ